MSGVRDVLAVLRSRIVKRNAVPIVAILVAAALVGLLVYGVVQRGANRTLDDAVASGKRPVAPTRSLPVLHGSGERSLASYRGKPVILNFWASWCTPCRIEAPLLESAQQRLSRAGGTVLGVTFRDASPDSDAFVKKFGLTYPSLRDVDGKLANAYGTRALPETFVIDRQGRVAALTRGVVDRQFLEDALAKVGV
jgi:cytochrome c biogenesis protein CcmG, thiol:disulfide interchange protein DsbE